MDTLSQEMAIKASLLPPSATKQQDEAAAIIGTPARATSRINVCDVKIGNAGTPGTTSTVDTSFETRSPPSVIRVDGGNDNNNGTTLVTCDWLPDMKRQALQETTGWHLRKEDEHEKEQNRRKKNQSTTTPVPRCAYKTTASLRAKRPGPSTIARGTTVFSSPKIKIPEVANKTTTSWLAKHPDPASITNRTATSHTFIPHHTIPDELPIANKTTLSWVAKHLDDNATSYRTKCPPKKRKQASPTPVKDFDVASKATKSWLAKHEVKEEVDLHHQNSNTATSRKRRKVTVPDDVAVANKATASWIAKHQHPVDSNGANNSNSANGNNRKSRKEKRRWTRTIPKDIANLASRPTSSFLARQRANRQKIDKLKKSEKLGEESSEGNRCPKFVQRMNKCKDRLLGNMVPNYLASTGSKESVADSISREAHCTSQVFPEQQHRHKFTEVCDDTVSLLSNRITTSWSLKKKTERQERSKTVPLLYKGFILGDDGQ